MNFLALAEEAFKKATLGGLREVRPQSYHTYITSPAWEDRKRRYYEKYPKRCVLCLTYKHIELNHLSYENLGDEWDEDLVPLCRACHALFHQRYGVKRVMRRQWNEFFRYNGKQW